MPYCIRCSTNTVCDGSEGLISINFSMNSSVRVAEDDSCSTNTGIENDFIPGPATASVTVNAYAFEAGTDKWLGSRCKGQAQASQTNIIKYDGKTDRYYMIPTKIHKAQIIGDVGNSVTLDKIFFTGVNVDMQSNNGVSITSELEVWLGAGFHYNGLPLPVDMPDLSPYTINLTAQSTSRAYLSSVNVQIDYPQPATTSYTFEFCLEGSTE